MTAQTTLAGFKAARGAVVVRDVNCEPLPESYFYGTPELVAEIAPAVQRAAAKMANKYRRRLQKDSVISREDLLQIGWVRVLSQLDYIEGKPTAYARAACAYTITCNAIHNEFAHIDVGGDAAIAAQGTLDTGAKDNSYDGGATAFSTDDVAPRAAVSAKDFWMPPALWDVWSRMNTRRRGALLTKVLHDEDYKEIGFESPHRHLLSKWNEIPFHIQEWIERVWKRTAKGELRRNKFANGAKPHNAFGFASAALPHPSELAVVTPPRLRAVSLLVYGARLYADGGDSINSGEISKILGKSARTILRDHTELMKLWGAYVRADAVEKRDEKKFPRYPLHTNIAYEFLNMPVDAQMPAPSNPVLESMMMLADRVRDLYQRMEKYRTDFSDATVTATIVTPRANIRNCGTSDFVSFNGERCRIIANPFNIVTYETPVPPSVGHTRVIDCYHNGEVWIPIRSFSDKSKLTPLPKVWLHDWSASDMPEMFASPPRKLFLTTQRSTSIALYPREQDVTKPAYCQCPLCVEMRREDQRRFDYTYFQSCKTLGHLDSTLEDAPLKRSALRIAILHGQDTRVGKDRYRETHFVCTIRGAELWTVEDFGKKFYVLTPPLPKPAHVESPYPHDWSDTVEVTETETIGFYRRIGHEGEYWRNGGQYEGRTHRVLNPHQLNCGETMTVAEIIAKYKSDWRKEATKASAANSAASREHNAWVLSDAGRTRDADARWHAALLAQGEKCRRPGCEDCKSVEMATELLAKT